MKRVKRGLLSDQALTHLRSKQAQIDEEAAPKARTKRAQQLWKGKKGSKAGQEAFAEIERILQTMCNGPSNGPPLCMYCEAAEALVIDHVEPKGRFPESTFRWSNYLLSCPICNSHFKLDRYHDDFMDPSKSGFDLWRRWGFDPGTGHYFPAQAEDAGAAVTLEILGFDRRKLHEWRQAHVVTVITGVREYAKARARGRIDEARQIAQAFSLRFPALVEWILTQEPSMDRFPDMNIVRLVKKRFPEIVRDALW